VKLLRSVETVTNPLTPSGVQGPDGQRKDSVPKCQQHLGAVLTHSCRNVEIAVLKIGQVVCSLEGGVGQTKVILRQEIYDKSPLKLSEPAEQAIPDVRRKFYS
jgi:hypothetical protein